MICGVFGLPRAGKTIFLTHIANRALRGKSLSIGMFMYKTYIGEFTPYKRVFTNFPLRGCIQLNFEDLGKYDFSESLILIDEIMLLCDSRDWKEFPKPLRNFLALAGHERIDLLYCSQGYRDTDLRFRNLTDKIFYIEKRGSWSKVAPIAKSWRIDQDIAEGYTLAPPIGCTWLYRPLYYQTVDSFDFDPKPANPAPAWPAAPCPRPGLLRCLCCASRWQCSETKIPKLRDLATVRHVGKGVQGEHPASVGRCDCVGSVGNSFSTLSMPEQLSTLRPKDLSATTNSGQKKYIFVRQEKNTLPAWLFLECPLELRISDLRGGSMGGLFDTCKPVPRVYDASSKWDFHAYEKPRYLAKISPLKSGIACNIDTVFLYVPYSRDFLPPA